MRIASPLKKTAIAATAGALLVLSGCGGSASEATPETDSPPTKQTTQSPEPEPSPTPEETASKTGSSLTPASWVPKVTTPGKKIATVNVGDITVDVYQVGTVPSPDKSRAVDPRDGKPIIAKGDPLVFVNYVITNHGKPIDLGYSLVEVDATYDNWPFLQDMGGITTPDAFDKFNIIPTGDIPTKFHDSGVYTFGSGKSYSAGRNFKYEKGAGITFTVTVTPVNSKGDLLTKKQMQAKAHATIN